MNDHLAVLIYLTAARLQQQRLQAGMVGGLKFRPESESHGSRRGEQSQGPSVQRRFTASQPYLNLRYVRSRYPAASQAACCYHFFPSAFTG